MSKNNITQIDLYKLRIPLKEPFVISLETITHAENVLVRLQTAGGLTGYGECSPYRTIAGETQDSAFSIGKELGRLLLGCDALQIERNLNRLDRHIAGNHCIKSAFDMALYDLAAQIAGLPLYAFLGGRNKGALRTDMTVSIGPPAKMADAALRFHQAGFEAVKIKLGTTYEEDVARVKAIRDAVGPGLPLRIDANQGWDVPTAIRTLQSLAPYGVEYCEAPISRRQLHQLPYVRANSPIPIMADESLFDQHDAFQLAQSGACDFFNIKLAKSGGIRNALRIIAVAEAAGIRSQVGCFSETRLGITALAHLALARTNIDHYDMDSFLMLSQDPVDGGLQYTSDGCITIPEAPGLGLTIKEEWLTRSEKERIR